VHGVHVKVRSRLEKLASQVAPALGSPMQLAHTAPAHTCLALSLPQAPAAQTQQRWYV